MIRLELERLVARAEYIFEGEVSAIRSVQENSQSEIYTYVEIAIHSTLKGFVRESQNEKVSIRFQGGKIANITSWVPGSPEFKVGDHVIVFAVTEKDGSLTSLGLFQGVFHVGRTDAGDLRIIENNLAYDEFKEKIGKIIRTVSSLVFSPANATPTDVVKGVRSCEPDCLRQDIEHFRYLGARWFQADEGKPVGFRVNAARDPTSGQGISLVKQGLEAWTQASPATISLISLGETTKSGFNINDGENTVTFGDPHKELGIGIAGKARITYDDSEQSVVGGRVFYQLIDSDIVFNERTFLDLLRKIPIIGGPPLSNYLAEISTHELGHCIGLAHSIERTDKPPEDPLLRNHLDDATMYFDSHDDGRGASLRKYDIEAVSALYPEQSNVVGRVVNDLNGNGRQDTSEPFVRDPLATCSTGTSIPGVVIKWTGSSSRSTSLNKCDPEPFYDTGKIPIGSYTLNLEIPWGWRVTAGNNQTVTTSANQTSQAWFFITQDKNPVTLEINKEALCVGDRWILTVKNAPVFSDVLLSGWLNGSLLFTNLNLGVTDGQGTLTANGIMPPGVVGNWHEQVTVAGQKSNIISFQVADCSEPGIPVISLDKSFYCAGDEWKLLVANGTPNSSIDLYGITNGSPWNISNWGKTDSKGSFPGKGKFSADVVGNYTLWVVIAGKESNRLSFSVFSCPTKALPTITSSLKLGQFGPYKVGQTISAQFAITNKGSEPIKFDVLTVGGRDPTDQVADFSWHRNIALGPGQSYSYFGGLTLAKEGPYHFFTAYRTPDDKWNTAIPTEGGITNTLDITVTRDRPQQFSLSALSGCSQDAPAITLTWTASDHATAYAIHRNGSLLANAGNLRSYKDTAINPGTSYSYFIRASNSAGSIDSNQITIQAIECAGKVNPEVAVSPPSGPRGTTFVLKGWSFSQQSLVTSYLQRPDGSQFPPLQLSTDDQGRFTHNIDSSRFGLGTYLVWVVDNKTSQPSNKVRFEVEDSKAEPPEVSSISPTSIVGSVFDLTIRGSRFDLNAVDQIYKANGSLLGSGTIKSRSPTEIVVTEYLAGAAPGTYIVKVKNADGQLSNGVTLTLITQVTLSPLSGVASTPFLYQGKGFTGNHGVTSRLKKPDGSEFPPLQIPTNSGGEFSHTINSAGFAPGTYQAWAVDNNTGIPSDKISFTVTSSGIASPSNLVATAISASRIDLSWRNNSDNEDGFKIERRRSSAPSFAQIATVGRNVTSYSDAGLEADTTYYYRVKAFNSTGDSNYSNEASATTQKATTAAARIDGYSPSSAVEVEVGKSALLSVTFTNIGSVAWDFTAGATVWDSVGAIVANYSRTVSLQANQQTTVSWNHTVTKVGDYWLQFGIWKDSQTLLDKKPSPSQPLIIGKSTTVTPQLFIWTSSCSKNQNGCSGPQGTTFHFEGTGFSPNGAATQRIRRPDGSEITGNVNVSSSGTLGWSWTSQCKDLTGTYVIQVVDNPSQKLSNSVTETVTASPNCAALPAPTTLTATASSSTQIGLTWQDNSANEDGFKIERKTGSSGFVEIATVAANITSYSDSGLANQTTYCYRVRAFKGSDYSGYSNEACASTGEEKPGPFTLTGKTGCSGTSPIVSLTWDRSVRATSYSVYRNNSLLANVGSNQSYTDSSVTVNTEYRYFIRASNSAGSIDSNTMWFIPQSCWPTLTITTDSNLPPAYSGIAYSVQLQASGGTGQGYTWARISGSDLPLGLSLSPNGLISGTPTFWASTPFTFTIQVKDSQGNAAAKDFSLTVKQGPTILNSSLRDGIVGISYSVQLQAEGGTPPYSWSASGVPAGLSLSASGLLAGTPTQRGTFTVAISLSDSGGLTVTKNFSLKIDYSTALRVNTASLPTGTVGVSYRASVEAVGGSQLNYQWSFVSGTLPPGLTFATFPCDTQTKACAGVLSGTPTQAGSYTFTVKVTDSDGNSAQGTFTVIINSAPTNLVIESTNDDLPKGTVGRSYSATLKASGGTETGYTWSLAGGSLPTGLNLSTGGVISGIPTEPNDCGSNFSKKFTARVTDSAGTSATKTFCLSTFWPTPEITKVSPGYVVVNGNDYLITVKGSNFRPEAKLCCFTEETTYVDASTLTTRIYAWSIPAFTSRPNGQGSQIGQGTYDLYVVLEGSRSPSNKVSYGIYNPSPTISKVTAVEENGKPCRVNTWCRLNIEGTGFTNMSSLKINEFPNMSINVQTYPSTKMPWTSLTSTQIRISSSGTFTLTLANSQAEPGTTGVATGTFKIEP